MDLNFTSKLIRAGSYEVFVTKKVTVNVFIDYEVKEADLVVQALILGNLESWEIKPKG